MTQLFITIRYVALFGIFTMAATIMGLTANFASIFLPTHRDWIITTLVISALTIVVTLVVALRSQPAVDIFVHFFMAVLWLAVAGFTTDISGHIECDSLTGQIPAKHGRLYSAQSYCRQQKLIEALAWANFAAFALMCITLLALTLRMHAMGHYGIWGASVSDLQWFDEGRAPGYMLYPQGTGQQMYSYPNVQNFGNSQPVYQLPGHNVVIQNGQVTQVPVGTPLMGGPPPGSVMGM